MGGRCLFVAGRDVVGICTGGFRPAFGKIRFGRIGDDGDRVVRVGGFGFVHAVCGFDGVPIGILTVLGFFIPGKRAGYDAVLRGFQTVEIQIDMAGRGVCTYIERLFRRQGLFGLFIQGKRGIPVRLGRGFGRCRDFGFGEGDFYAVVRCAVRAGFRTFCKGGFFRAARAFGSGKAQKQQQGN